MFFALLRNVHGVSVKSFMAMLFIRLILLEYLQGAFTKSFK